MSDSQPNASEAKKRLYKRWWLWVGVVALIIIVSSVGYVPKKPVDQAATDAPNKLCASNDAVMDASNKCIIPYDTDHTRVGTTKLQQATPVPVNSVSPTTQPTDPAVQVETVSQKNAVSKAKQYLSVEAFSHDGLVSQLEFDKFSAADAMYGADNSDGDWNAQAAKKANEYMSIESFSRQGLIDQLEFDQFTTDQATYGANMAGL